MKKPNLLYVFPDQFRLMSLSIWQDAQYQAYLPGVGDPVSTPHLDAFIRQSTLLSNAVSNCPVCSPHRGSLMTGQFPSRSGVPLNCNSDRIHSELPETAFCFTNALSMAGYHVGYIGKWHLDVPTPNDPVNPGHYVDPNVPAWDSYTEPQRRHGIDYWYGYGTFDEHNNPHYYDTHGVRHEPKVWSAEHETDKAIEYLKNEHGERDPDKPFALFMSMNPPHSPYDSLDDCRLEDWLRYKDTPVEELLLRNNADTHIEKAHSAAYYFANVTGTDSEFGRLVNELKALGEWENTVVVFTSDHGETLCSQGINDAKNCIYNEAFSVPFVIKGAQSKQVKQHSVFLSSADIMPTVLGVMGLEQQCPNDIHGRNLSNAVFANTSASLPSCALYIRNIDGYRDHNNKVVDYFPVSRGLKTQRYTLALEVDTQGKLEHTLFFDNALDPYQLHNLSFNPDAPIERCLLRALAEELVRTDDPWVAQRWLTELLPYHLFSRNNHE
ncbi:sulfatase [Vibrio sp. JPW-9-11-11]|uniref:sulfatase family protein n=1 Tax=Vibrio sp. JPW-9-11-11 TaxID=1416532 RepID=UPI001593F05A|nr:sulfatase [Vibrio sp. JPW-9-11-11]NVD06466.1 sulfatase [Vibrio sp. JPW-9-11-11]